MGLNGALKTHEAFENLSLPGNDKRVLDYEPYLNWWDLESPMNRVLYN